MSIIRIFSNDLEIEFKKSTLTLKKENNSLSTEFKVTHSSFPFLVIDNDVAKKALGSNDITSTSKKKVIPVTVLEFGVKYTGELQQLSIQRGYRKCNLKYSSDLLPIINKKISEFMPLVSVIPGETDPIPYTEESDIIITGADNWETFPVSMIGKVYPEVKFQFPTMYWKNKYGIDLTIEDSWLNYKNYVNLFGTNDLDETIFLINTQDIDGTTITINQLNVPSPQVFLLSPLYYICEYLGWSIAGNFQEHDLIKRTLLLSIKDNLSKIILYPEGEFINFDSAPFNYNPIMETYTKVYHFPITEVGDYKLIFRFEILPAPSGWGNHNVTQLILNPPGDDNTVIAFQKITHRNLGNNYIIEGEAEFNVPSGSTPGVLLVIYHDNYSNEPIDYSMEVILLDSEKEFSQMHPTINLGRYVPEWTVGNYLNHLKNKFNLDISLDDFKKEITLNLNENIDANETPVILEKSLVNEGYELAANSSFVLKEANDEDIALFISKDELSIYENQEDDYTQLLKSEFKLVPRNNYTSELGETVTEKEGVGLMIYEPLNAPYTSESTISEYTLSIPGTKGIYETFFRRWLKFRLNASRVTLQGYFTEMEISKIYKMKSIYIDNQRYRIESIEYTEETNNYYALKMVLESVNF